MPKTYTVTEYDKDDIESLDAMTTEEIIAALDHIDDGWLPRDVVYMPQEFKTYTESQYQATRLHKAVRKAIEIIKKTESDITET